MTTALITGITGQDGSYLAELLLAKGYEVHGIIRRSSTFNTARIDHIFDHARLHLHHGDMTEPVYLMSLLDEHCFDEVYHLAAQSHVAVSYTQPAYTFDVAATGTLRLLEALRSRASTGSERIYYACSSEIFGRQAPPQNEDTTPDPRSPYAVAKLAGLNLCRMYRDAYGMDIRCGILFNHESPRRGETFVTRKITRGLARIKAGLQKRLCLGNLHTLRDWGHAREYVAGIHQIMQLEEPADYVLATGKSASVLDFLTVCAEWFGLDESVVVQVPRYLRPLEVPHLCGDATRAREAFGWAPRLGMREIAEEMCRHDQALTAGQVPDTVRA